MSRSTILGSVFGVGSSFLHFMRVYGRPFSVNTQVKMNYHLSQSVQTKAPNTFSVLSIGLVNNPLISPQFCNSVLDRYDIINFRVAVLIAPLKWSPWFHNYSSAGTDAKYESEQTILSVISHGSTSSFSTCVTWGKFSSSSSYSASCLADLTILRRIIIPDPLHAALWISTPFSSFLSIPVYIFTYNLIQLPPCPYHLDMYSLA